MAQPITNPIPRLLECIFGSMAYASFMDWLSFYLQMYNARFFTLFTITAVRGLAGGYKAAKEGKFSKKILMRDTSDAFICFLLVFSGIQLAMYIEPNFEFVQDYLYGIFAVLMLKSIVDNSSMSNNVKNSISKLLKDVSSKKVV